MKEVRAPQGGGGACYRCRSQLPATAMYRLISAPPSPYSRKVRIQLAEKSIPFELITEVPWDSDA